MTKWMNPNLIAAPLREIDEKAEFALFLDRAPDGAIIDPATVVGHGRVDFNLRITEHSWGAATLRVTLTEPANYDAVWHEPEPADNLRATRAGDIQYVALTTTNSGNAGGFGEILYTTTCPTVRVVEGQRLTVAPFQISIGPAH